MEAKSTLKKFQGTKTAKQTISGVSYQRPDCGYRYICHVAHIISFYTFSLMEDDEKNNLQIPEDPQRKTEETLEAEED